MDADKVKPGEYVVKLLRPDGVVSRWWIALTRGAGECVIPSAALIRRVELKPQRGGR
jgi:hypothetical protein